MSHTAPNGDSVVNDRSISLSDFLVGIDHSGARGPTGKGQMVHVAVLCNRRQEMDLVDIMNRHNLMPFRYKSSTIVKSGPLDKDSRKQAVKDFLADVRETPITWASVIQTGDIASEYQAAATCMCMKKSITQLPIENLPHRIDGIFDGKPNPRDAVQKSLKSQFPNTFDENFRENLCDIRYGFAAEADKILPQAIAADYIAGYLREVLSKAPSESNDEVYGFDDSWSNPVDPVENCKIRIPETGELVDTKEYVESWISLRRSESRIANLERELENIDDTRVKEYLRRFA